MSLSLLAGRTVRGIIGKWQLSPLYTFSQGESYHCFRCANHDHCGQSTLALLFVTFTGVIVNKWCHPIVIEHLNLV